MEKKNPFDLLGLPTTASADDAKRAYRAAAVKAHPDKGGSDDEFHQIQWAFEQLSDPGSRLRWATKAGQRASADPFAAYHSHHRPPSSHDVKMKQAPETEQQLPVSFEVCARGGEATATLAVAEQCECRRRGRAPAALPGASRNVDLGCPLCHNTGTVTRSRAIRQNVPAGAYTGLRLHPSPGVTLVVRCEPAQQSTYAPFRVARLRNNLYYVLSQPLYVDDALALQQLALRHPVEDRVVLDLSGGVAVSKLVLQRLDVPHRYRCALMVRNGGTAACDKRFPRGNLYVDMTVITDRFGRGASLPADDAGQGGRITVPEPVTMLPYEQDKAAEQFKSASEDQSPGCAQQ